MQNSFDEHKSKTEKDLSDKATELSTAKEKISELRGSIDTLTQAHETAKQTMKEQHNKEMSSAQQEINQLRKQLDDTNRHQLFMKNRRVSIGWKTFWMVLVIGLIFWFFVSSPENDEPMGWLLNAINNLDETRKTFARGSLLFVVSLVLIPLSISLWKSIKSKYKTRED